MRKQYDFSKSVKNPYLRKPKKQVTIRLDEETIAYFKALSIKRVASPFLDAPPLTTDDLWVIP